MVLISFRILGLFSSASFPVTLWQRYSSPARLNALKAFPDKGLMKVHTCSVSGGFVRMHGNSFPSQCFLQYRPRAFFVDSLSRPDRIRYECLSQKRYLPVLVLMAYISGQPSMVTRENVVWRLWNIIGELAAVVTDEKTNYLCGCHDSCSTRVTLWD